MEWCKSYYLFTVHATKFLPSNWHIEHINCNWDAHWTKNETYFYEIGDDLLQNIKIYYLTFL